MRALRNPDAGTDARLCGAGRPRRGRAAV